MAKKNFQNPLDQSIQKWASVFTSIDGFGNIVTDEELKAALIS